MHNRRRYRTVFVATLVAVGLGAFLYRQCISTSDQINTPSRDRTRRSAQDRAAAPRSFDLPPISASRFVNASPNVEYVGEQVCAECHQDEHESYLRTTHSQALAPVDVKEEPEDVEFVHDRSGRTYKVYRENGQMRHRESIYSPAGSEFVLCDYPMRDRIGSGNHSRSYLVETDGFLIESPLTWYASKKAWAMSPGYDIEHHLGFQRTADVGCVFCHAGRVEASPDSRFRVSIHDGAISCETCHGPGALHVARHQDDDAAKQDTDVTIVNPIRLSRERNESICSQCHLRGAASVMHRGRRMTSFRPGLTLADFRTDYELEHPDESMSVVGHVEQMKRSRCYKQSETLTCTTCHNPHGTPADTERIEYYRTTCLGCHSENACELDVDVRKKTDQQDNCVACHMPQGATDIPHFAFTHHRIGVHKPIAADTAHDPPAISNLVPLHDTSHLSESDRDRGLGLAYLELSDKQRSPITFEAYRDRAIRLLESVRQDGMRDSEVDATLARLYWESNDLQRAASLAEDAIREGGESGATTNALFVLGDSCIRLNNPGRALSPLMTLVEQRRQSEDWVLLGICHQSEHRLEPAIEALEHAAEISPDRVDIHQMLTELYQAVGQPKAADRHRQLARVLASRPQ